MNALDLFFIIYVAATLAVISGCVIAFLAERLNQKILNKKRAREIASKARDSIAKWKEKR